MRLGNKKNKKTENENLFAVTKGAEATPK